MNFDFHKRLTAIQIFRNPFAIGNNRVPVSVQMELKQIQNVTLKDTFGEIYRNVTAAYLKIPSATSSSLISSQKAPIYLIIISYTSCPSYEAASRTHPTRAKRLPAQGLLYGYGCSNMAYPLIFWVTISQSTFS